MLGEGGRPRGHVAAWRRRARACDGSRGPPEPRRPGVWGESGCSGIWIEPPPVASLITSHHHSSLSCLRRRFSRASSSLAERALRHVVARAADRSALGVARRGDAQRPAAAARTARLQRGRAAPAHRRRDARIRGAAARFLGPGQLGLAARPLRVQTCAHHLRRKTEKVSTSGCNSHHNWPDPETGRVHNDDDFVWIVCS